MGKRQLIDAVGGSEWTNPAKLGLSDRILSGSKLSAILVSIQHQQQDGSSLLRNMLVQYNRHGSHDVHPN